MSQARTLDFEGVVTKMLQSKPDGLLFISGALDVARLAQAARKLAPRASHRCVRMGSH